MNLGLGPKVGVLRFRVAFQGSEQGSGVLKQRMGGGPVSKGVLVSLGRRQGSREPSPGPGVTVLPHLTSPPWPWVSERPPSFYLPSLPPTATGPLPLCPSLGSGPRLCGLASPEAISPEPRAEQTLVPYLDPGGGKNGESLRV